RLTGARGAGDEHEAARPVGEDVKARRDAQLLERLDLGRDQAEGRAKGLTLPVHVHAEAREARDRVCEVDLAVELELLLLLGGENAVEQLLRAAGRQRAAVSPRLGG